MSVVFYDLCGRDNLRFSPYCWRTKMALAHKGLDADTRPVAFTQIAAIGDGSLKTVPVIDDGGTVVSDSFEIARYLERAYPAAPTLFGGPGGEAAARFVESWAATAIHANVISTVVLDIHNCLLAEDQAYFRNSREARFGKTLEAAQEGREQRVGAIHAAFQPLRLTLQKQPFLGGDGPLFIDYVVFGSLQWPRIVSSFPILPPADDAVTQWFERCLDLFGGLGRSAVRG